MEILKVMEKLLQLNKIIQKNIQTSFKTQAV